VNKNVHIIISVQFTNNPVTTLKKQFFGATTNQKKQSKET